MAICSNNFGSMLPITDINRGMIRDSDTYHYRDDRAMTMRYEQEYLNGTSPTYHGAREHVDYLEREMSWLKEKHQHELQEAKNKGKEEVINNLETDKCNESLQKLIGEIYALGYTVGKDRGRFQTQEAFDEWSKNKPHSKVKDKLNTFIHKIKSCFATKELYWINPTLSKDIQNYTDYVKYQQQKMSEQMIISADIIGDMKPLLYKQSSISPSEFDKMNNKLGIKNIW